jgi:hypothetical protein
VGLEGQRGHYRGGGVIISPMGGKLGDLAPLFEN